VKEPYTTYRRFNISFAKPFPRYDISVQRGTGSYSVGVRRTNSVCQLTGKHDFAFNILLRSVREEHVGVSNHLVVQDFFSRECRCHRNRRFGTSQHDESQLWDRDRNHMNISSTSGLHGRPTVIVQMPLLCEPLVVSDREYRKVNRMQANTDVAFHIPLQARVAQKLLLQVVQGSSSIHDRPERRIRSTQIPKRCLTITDLNMLSPETQPVSMPVNQAYNGQQILTDTAPVPLVCLR
jgi:hypothetical protein